MPQDKPRFIRKAGYHQRKADMFAKGLVHPESLGDCPARRAYRAEANRLRSKK
jgi:hypothetical protein